MARLCLVCLDSVLCWQYKEYAPQVTFACKPSSTIARFKNTDFVRQLTN